MLRPDVTVTELARLVDRELDDLFRARRERDLARRGRGVAAADDELDRLTHFAEVHPEGIEHPCRDALALTHQPEKEMLGSYLWLKRIASSCARASTRFARSLKRSNGPLPPSMRVNLSRASVGAPCGAVSRTE